MDIGSVTRYQIHQNLQNMNIMVNNQENKILQGINESKVRINFLYIFLTLSIYICIFFFLTYLCYQHQRDQHEPQHECKQPSDDWYDVNQNIKSPFQIIIEKFRFHVHCLLSQLCSMFRCPDFVLISGRWLVPPRNPTGTNIYSRGTNTIGFTHHVFYCI